MRPLPSLQEHAVFLALTCFMFRDKQQLEICLLTHPLIQVIVSSYTLEKWKAPVKNLSWPRT